jgi:hypothetical protein
VRGHGCGHGCGYACSPPPTRFMKGPLRLRQSGSRSLATTWSRGRGVQTATLFPPTFWGSFTKGGCDVFPLSWDLVARCKESRRRPLPAQRRTYQKRNAPQLAVTAKATCCARRVGRAPPWGWLPVQDVTEERTEHHQCDARHPNPSHSPSRARGVMAAPRLTCPKQPSANVWGGLRPSHHCFTLSTLHSPFSL